MQSNYRNAVPTSASGFTVPQEIILYNIPEDDLESLGGLETILQPVDATWCQFPPSATSGPCNQNMETRKEEPSHFVQFEPSLFSSWCETPRQTPKENRPLNGRKVSVPKTSKVEQQTTKRQSNGNVCPVKTTLLRRGQKSETRIQQRRRQKVARPRLSVRARVEVLQHQLSKASRPLTQASRSAARVLSHSPIASCIGNKDSILQNIVHGQCQQDPAMENTLLQTKVTWNNSASKVSLDRTNGDYSDGACSAQIDQILLSSPDAPNQPDEELLCKWLNLDLSDETGETYDSESYTSEVRLLGDDWMSCEW